jgi:hypothetical protein
MRFYTTIFIFIFLVAPNAWCVSGYKKHLHKKAIKGHRGLSYKAARSALFGKIYLQRGSYIRDVYCQIEFGKGDGVGPGKIPDHKKLNTEHAWPKTRFSKDFPRDLQKSDLFHLFPTANGANSYRGDLIFGEEAESRELIPNCPLSSRGRSQFTPPDDIKGDLARALFYFSVRYNVPIDDREERTLRKWHQIDPVDRFELEKNYLVEKYQGNRNPFIDQPDVVNLVEDF